MGLVPGTTVRLPLPWTAQSAAPTHVAQCTVLLARGRGGKRRGPNRSRESGRCSDMTWKDF